MACYFFSFTDNEQADAESLLRLQKDQTVCSSPSPRCCPFPLRTQQQKQITQISNLADEYFIRYYSK